MGKKRNGNEPTYRTNSDIKIGGSTRVRVCGEGIESKVVTMYQARKIAEELELDIIEINSSADTPVMKIADYDKMMYDLKKRQKKQKTSQLKEIQLTVNIARNDMETKARKARDFINGGDKVKVVLRMKGRELSRRDENKKSILEFITMLEDCSVPESMPKDEGNKTVVILKKKK